jgi:predicted NAD/FAD-binding protein
MNVTSGLSGQGNHRRQRVAIIGSGISGTAAAWALAPTHDVTLYEADKRAGGHTATVTIDYDGTQVAVDTGFIVYNVLNYPNLTALFAHLGVATHESDMSFALSLDQGKLEWSGDSLRHLFARKRNALSPSFLWMLREILRFNGTCVADRNAGAMAGLSIGEYLTKKRFSTGFRENYLIPMAAAIWSTPSAQMMDFPAETFVTFFENHRLINRERPGWRTVTGGAKTYLERMLDDIGRQNLRLGDPVKSVIRAANGIGIITEAGRIDGHDHVIMAGHSDQMLAVLEKPTIAEEQALSAIRYAPNRVILHRDRKLMPEREMVWASWNYLRDSKAGDDQAVAVSYWMNRLQGIDRSKPLFVTLNPHREPDSDLVFGEWSYSHPLFDRAAIQAQKKIAAIQGDNRTWFAGAWTGYGFHEDGLRSGLTAAEGLGAIVPWRGSGSANPAEAVAAQ